MNSKYQRHFDNLALKFATNLFHISIDENEATEALKSIFDKNSNIKFNQYKFPKERIIAIIGAGASYDANNKIPLASEGAKQLLEKYNDTIKQLVKKEIKRLSQVYKLNEKEFETVLLAINKFSSKIDENLFSIYNFRFYPSLLYELLAHLFKNRFIDAIINYNFDELLDQSIDDEVSHGEYKKVVLDGDCPENFFNDIMYNDRFRLPLYIKPHGTVSHKSSMKFTREDYFNLSSDINMLIANLMSGKLSEKDKNPIPVNLLIFGFGMQSFELNNILVEELPNHSKVYFFDIKKPSLDNKLKKSFKKKYIVPQYIKTEVGYSIGDYLKEICLGIQDVFSENYKPRKILRHELISNLFSDKEGERENIPSKNVAYFKDRTYIEILLSIVKAYGFISIQQLSKDRAGKYYNLYKKALDESEKKGEETEKIKPLYEFCTDLGLVEFGYSRDVFSLLGNEEDEYLIITLDSDEFKKKFINNLGARRNLIERVLNCVSEELQNTINEENTKQLFIDTLKNLYNADDTEICPQYETIYDNVFCSPKIISTKLGLEFQTNKLFSINGLDDWDLLLSVAESGEWIIKKGEGTKKKYICQIVADKTHSKKLEEISDFYQIHHLKWWLHNQHMSLYLKKRDNYKGQEINNIKDIFEYWDVKKAIYFTRRQRDALIIPVILDEPDDQKLAVRTFFAYLTKSHLKELKKDSINTSDVNNTMKEFFDELGKK